MAGGGWSVGQASGFRSLSSLDTATARTLGVFLPPRPAGTAGLNAGHAAPAVGAKRSQEGQPLAKHNGRHQDYGGGVGVREECLEECGVYGRLMRNP